MADISFSKQLLLHQFINGLPGSLSTQLLAAGHINDLNTAIELTKLLLTSKVKPDKIVAIESNKVVALKDQISALTEQVVALTSSNHQMEQTTWKCSIL